MPVLPWNWHNLYTGAAYANTGDPRRTSRIVAGAPCRLLGRRTATRPLLPVVTPRSDSRDSRGPGCRGDCGFCFERGGGGGGGGGAEVALGCEVIGYAPSDHVVEIRGQLLRPPLLGLHRWKMELLSD